MFDLDKDSIYYILKNGNTVGPFSKLEIIDFIARKELNSKSNIHKNDRWLTLKDLEEFKPYLVKDQNPKILFFLISIVMVILIGALFLILSQNKNDDLTQTKEISGPNSSKEVKNEEPKKDVKSDTNSLDTFVSTPNNIDLKTSNRSNTITENKPVTEHESIENIQSNTTIVNKPINKPKKKKDEKLWDDFLSNESNRYNRIKYFVFEVYPKIKAKSKKSSKIEDLIENIFSDIKVLKESSPDLKIGDKTVKDLYNEIKRL
jgi:hypothetical protein